LIKQFLLFSQLLPIILQHSFSQTHLLLWDGFIACESLESCQANLHLHLRYQSSSELFWKLWFLHAFCTELGDLCNPKHLLSSEIDLWRIAISIRAIPKTRNQQQCWIKNNFCPKKLRNPYLSWYFYYLLRFDSLSWRVSH